MNFHPIDASIRSTLFTAVLIAAGCVAHLPTGTTPTNPTSPTPASSSSAPASSPPTGCASTATAAPGVLLVGVTLQIGTSTATPLPYGSIGGYALVDQTTNPPQITQTTAIPIPLLPTDRVQFVNVDGVRSLSAVGVASSAIPASGLFPPTYAFSSTASVASGTQIDGRGQWSTGDLQPGCYSQVFTFPGPGTYYFGDRQFYATPTVFLRDVFVVSASAPQSSARRP